LRSYLFHIPRCMICFALKTVLKQCLTGSQERQRFHLVKMCLYLRVTILKQSIHRASKVKPYRVTYIREVPCSHLCRHVAYPVRFFAVLHSNSKFQDSALKQATINSFPIVSRSTFIIIHRIQLEITSAVDTTFPNNVD